MISLAKRLRELNKEEFESLIHQFLLAKFPGADIKKVDGIGGDQGIDSFTGSLADGPSVWQSKHFPDRIRRSQKEQILHSIKVAFKANKPIRWTMCIPIDLRTEEHKWFQSSVVDKYKAFGKIELIQASDILKELTHNRPLRDAFFPDHSISNALAIRQLVTNTEGKSVEQTGQLTAEYAQQFLEGNIDLDPRLDPIVSIGLTRLPPASRSSMPVMSITKGNMAIDYYARDPAAYNLDPINLQMTLTKEHSCKIEHTINTGAALKLPIGAVLKLDSKSPLLRHLFDQGDPRNLELHLYSAIPPELASKVIPLRFVAGTCELAYIPFHITQRGQQEITLESTSNLPLHISITLTRPPNQSATISISPRILSANVIDLSTVFTFLAALETAGTIEVFSLDPPSTFLHEAHDISNGLNIHHDLIQLINDAALISRRFGIPLLVPQEITDLDERNIRILKRMATGESFSDANINSVFVKSSEHQKLVMEFLDREDVSIKLDSQGQQIGVFGKIVAVGPTTFTADGVIAQDKETLRQKYLSAPEGTEIPWQAYCKGQCRFQLIQT